MMCGYFCIGFIDSMLAGKTLADFTNLFSRNNFSKNDDIILNYFMATPDMYPNFGETPLNIPLNDQQNFRLKKERINEQKKQ